MPKTDQICESCRARIEAIFDPSAGPRTTELISGQRLVNECCFVADEIHFTGDGQLVFAPRQEREGYCQECYVVCRKLFVRGGHRPGGVDPCGPDDPGRMYNNNNVITWLDRLRAASDGADFSPPKAGDGASHDRNIWSDMGQGNHGQDGGDGTTGAQGNRGGTGRSAPSFALLALEVEIGAGDNLTIDFDGQNGGKGGKGQNGGSGGDGMGGRDGESDTTWPGTGCDRQPGSGGDGGRGGDGGEGGDGGDGGSAGDITIVSTTAGIAGSGPFLGGRIHYVNDGGDGGEGGKGGVGGRGGRGGRPGRKTSECDEAHPGDAGDEGLPTGLPAVGSDANKGATGGAGAGGSIAFEEVKEGTCADLIPLPELRVDSVNPTSGARGASVPVEIKGVGFDPAATVHVSGLLVSVSSLTVVDGTTITCTFDIGNAAPTTARDVRVRIGLRQAELTGGFTVTS